MHQRESANIPFTFLIKTKTQQVQSKSSKPDYTLAPHQNAVRAQKPASSGLEALPVTAINIYSNLSSAPLYIPFPLMSN